MKKNTTLTRWLSVLLLALWLGLLLLCLFISLYTGHAMRQQAAEANDNLLRVYLEKVDSNVSGVNRFLSQFASSNYSTSVMARTDDSTEFYLAKQDVMKQLRNTTFIYNMFNGIFVYSDVGMGEEFLCQLRDGTSLQQQEDIRDYVIREHPEGHPDGWRVVRQEGRVYLLCTIQTGDTCCGAWLEPQSALQPLTGLQLGENGSIVMLDLDGAVLSETRDTGSGSMVSKADSGTVIQRDGQEFLQISQTSQTLPVEMMALIPESVFAGKVQVTQTVIILVFAAVLLAFLALGYFMNRSVSQPVKALTKVMGQVGQGDLYASASESSRFEEFRLIASSFNRMTGQIRQLQRDVYQRVLSEQRTRLQYLQMQIRPHFFLNVLNVIYSFSLTGRNDLIEQLTLCLSRYFRYLFRCESSFVPLGAELEHIGNYMEIHRLRDQGEFDYHQEIDEVLLEAQIPPLSIQPFVENSIKYGHAPTGRSELFLTAECRQVDGEQLLSVTIRDNGPGYPDKILEDWAKGGPLGDDVTEKIGLVNVRQRLQLTYGPKARVRLYNGPDCGAYSELLLPLRWQEDEEGMENDDPVG